MESGGRSWVRAKVIGRGSYGTVSLATSKTRRTSRSRTRSTYDYEYPSQMAVKSAEISDSASLQKERQVLRELQDCPYILRCYGEEFTDEKNGNMVYNLLLEYASGGTLAGLIDKSEAGLPECEIKRFTREILVGLMCIHRKGYVHLDIKPDNILLASTSLSRKRKRKQGFEFDAKIGDFGLAKRLGRRIVTENEFLIGTPEYMSPESITDCKQEPAVDIWALGCVVVEMVTGEPALSSKSDEDVDGFLDDVASGVIKPNIPTGMSKQGQDFLKRCFVRNSDFRWTAEMLLLHPFVALEDIDRPESQKLSTPLVGTRDCLVSVES